jgi:integrase
VASLVVAAASDEARTLGFAVAAIRLLILTGARLREILDAQWQPIMHLGNPAAERGALARRSKRSRATQP